MLQALTLLPRKRTVWMKRAKFFWQQNIWKCMKIIRQDKSHWCVWMWFEFIGGSSSMILLWHECYGTSITQTIDINGSAYSCVQCIPLHQCGVSITSHHFNEWGGSGKKPRHRKMSKSETSKFDAYDKTSRDKSRYIPITTHSSSSSHCPRQCRR